MANQPLQDKDYDLVSTVYHASQGCETCGQYAADAKSAGDNDTAAYFEEAQQQYAQLVEKGKSLLKARL